MNCVKLAETRAVIGLEYFARVQAAEVIKNSPKQPD